jgi:hypothetical protein
MPFAACWNPGMETPYLVCVIVQNTAEKNLQRFYAKKNTKKYLAQT